MVTSFVLITALFIFLSPAKAEVPGKVNYQGYLTDSEEYPIDGIVDMEFAIYSQEFEGSPIWFEPHYGVTVTAGVYNVILGETSSVSYDLFLSSCWLEVAVGEEGAAELEVLEPRQPIVSSFFAIYAHNADYLDGMDSADFAEAEHGHPIDEITGSIDADTVDGHEGAALEESQEIIDAIDAHELLPSIHHTKTTSFTDLSDMATDAQIPDNITINYALTAGDAETVDGFEGHERYTDAAAIEAGQNEFVNEIGDTITGDLNILGNVGIGTTSVSPAFKLDVVGQFVCTDSSRNQTVALKADGNVADLRASYFGVGPYPPLTFTTHALERMRISSSGQVGIGTITPDDLLDVSGSYGQVVTGDYGSFIMERSTDNNGAPGFQLWKSRGSMAVPTTVVEDDMLGEIRWAGYNGATYKNAAAIIGFIDGEPGTGGSTTDMPARLTFWTTPDGSPAYQERMRIDNQGNVGIGTTGPKRLLHVSRTIGGYSSSMGTWYPESAMMIGHDGSEADPNDYTGIFFNVGSSLRATAFMGLVDEDGTSGIAERLVFGTRYQGGHIKEAMAIDENSRVGIGTTDPQALLHVAGDARIDGNIAAKYQDVAEWVESSQKLEPGTVVVIDVKNFNRVVPSTLAYDTGIAGVVSEEPGLLLGEAGNGKYKISHSGRVKTKVDASFGAIRPGDLLVASSIPGVAMKSEPFECNGRRIHQPGTILGKALEAIDEGEGMILVLISLQ